MGRRADDGQRSEWSERFRRRDQSGLTVVDFCEWEGVSVASFYNWQKKLRGTKSRSQSVELMTPEGKSQRSLQKASFLPVHVMQPGAASPSTRIEIQLTNGVRVFVPISDAETVQKTIAVASRLSIPDGTVINQDVDPAEDTTC
jgi:hypothetical protein